MTASLRLSTGLAPRRHSLFMAVLAVGGSFCIAAAGLALWPEEASAATGTDTDIVETSPLAQQRQRCETCGVIESIRHSQAGVGMEASWEFAVRLPDGSLRHSSDPRPGQWQVGDRMQLLGGDRTWSAH